MDGSLVGWLVGCVWGSSSSSSRWWWFGKCIVYFFLSSERDQLGIKPECGWANECVCLGDESAFFAIT